MSLFTKLIYESDLYNQDFIRKYGERSSHWFTSSDQQKELSLRHDLCCVLLCNMEVNEGNNKNGSEEKKESEKPDETKTKSSSSNKDSLPEEENDNDFMEDIEMSGNESDESEAEIINVTKPTDPEEDMYRFICLEGITTVSYTQSRFSTKWKMPKTPNSQWDVIDKKLRKFIEVKVSTNIALCKETFWRKSMDIEEWTSLVVIDPNIGTMTWVNHPGGLKGENKVTGFIIKRRIKMRDYGIMETNLREEVDIEAKVFHCKEFNKLVEEWYKPFWNLRNASKPCNLGHFSEKESFGKLTTITPATILKYLEDPAQRKLDPVLWQGKILPDPICANITTANSTDLEMIMELICMWSPKTMFPENKNETSESYLNLLREMENNIMEGKTTFNVLTNSNKLDSKIKHILGIEMKKITRDDSISDFKQPDAKPAEKKMYHPWFDTLLREMIENVDEDLETYPESGLMENESKHPMGNVAQYAFRKIVNDFGRTKMSLYSSKCTNVYSRLGGAYLSRKIKSSHSNIVCFPIYARTRKTEGNTDMRMISGMLVRGPHHAKALTDKINFVTFEMVDTRKEGAKYLPFIKKPTILRTDNPNIIIVARQNAETKHACSYTTFNLNSLFIVTNLIGEILINNPNIPRNYNLKDAAESFCHYHKRWIRERILEALMMATIGSNQEEGLLSMLRKMFMVAIEWKRGYSAVSWEPEDFCQAFNECLIDRPLAMHFAHSMYKVIEIMSAEINT
uniref:Polymerase PA n=1 Tax=Neuropteran orthomyxo-related virus OKIAV190 TaxID=2792560 RepID=A0A7T0M3D0_9ORTO|nr:polymerase PA [Neuropteran orthomyxo-related virus OKIAV190]